VKKIPTYFDRDWSGDRSRVVPTVNPDCRWVADGEGVATQKIDGACAMIRDGKLFKRREMSARQQMPVGFELVATDLNTDKAVGWLPVGDGPEDRWFREAFGEGLPWQDGTYELLGPKVQGNPEGYGAHVLISHDQLLMSDQPPRDFDGLRAWMSGQNIEGVVWHHPDGRRAKLKLRDFGLSRAADAAKPSPSGPDILPRDHVNLPPDDAESGE
jgi:hypothetical protein